MSMKHVLTTALIAIVAVAVAKMIPVLQQYV